MLREGPRLVHAPTTACCFGRAASRIAALPAGSAALRAGAFFARIRNDHAVAKSDDPVRVGRDFGIVRHDDHRNPLLGD